MECCTRAPLFLNIYVFQASKAERAKKSPTYKDLDFMEMFPEGLLLEPET